MITKLEMKNYRQFSDTTVTFTPGLNVIRGPNNSGKTTIQEAIAFALFGSRATLDTGRGWVREGSKAGRVRLWLTTKDGDEITIVRTPTDAELYINGEEVTNYLSEASRTISEVLGVSFQAFLLGYNVRQKEIDLLTAMTKGRRRAEVERLLSIDRVDIAISNLRGSLAERQTEFKTLIPMLKDTDKINQDIERSKLNIDTFKRQLEEAEIEKEKVERQLESVKSQLDALEKVKSTLQVLQSMRNKTEKSLESWRKKLEVIKPDIERLQPAVEEFETLKSAVEGFDYDEYVRLIEKIERYNLAFKIYTSIEKPAYSVEELENKLTDVRAQLLNLRSVKAAKDLTCPFGGECDSATSPMERVKLSKARKEQLEEEELRLIELIRRAKKYNTAKEKFEEARANLPENHEELLVELTTKAETYERLKEVEKLVITYQEKVKMLDQISSMIDKEQESLKELDEQIKEVGVFDEDEYKKLKTEVDNLKVLLSSEEETIKKKTTQLALEERTIQDLAADLENQKQLQSRIEDLKTQIEITENDVLMLRMFKKYISDKILPTVKEVANSLFFQIVGDRYDELSIDDDFNLEVKTFGGSTRSLKSISGSEEDVACLCLRLALSSLAAGGSRAIDFIMLDEITASFDDERTEATAKALLSLRNLYNQIIWVSHKSIEAEFADNVIQTSLVNANTSTVL